MAGDCGFSQLSAVFPCPKAAVPSTEFASLVSRKEAFPLGESRPCAVTVAVKL